MIIGISVEYKQRADRILSEILGLNHYLVKPYDPKRLLALVAPLRLPGRGAGWDVQSRRPNRR